MITYICVFVFIFKILIIKSLLLNIIIFLQKNMAKKYGKNSWNEKFSDFKKFFIKLILKKKFFHFKKNFFKIVFFSFHEFLP
jgi:hypothetical protein